MGTRRFRGLSSLEAVQGFIEGVAMVNDSALTLLAIELWPGGCYAVVYTDSDHDEPVEVGYDSWEAFLAEVTNLPSQLRVIPEHVDED